MRTKEIKRRRNLRGTQIENKSDVIDISHHFASLQEMEFKCHRLNSSVFAILMKILHII